MNFMPAMTVRSESPNNLIARPIFTNGFPSPNAGDEAVPDL